MISVIMSTYNEPSSLVMEALNSIIQQTYSDMEILVCLDNPISTVNSQIIKFAKNDSRIKVLQNSTNLGLPKTLNRLLYVAQGDYIARMDADDISMNIRLEEEIKFLKENGLDLVASNVADINMEGKNTKVVTEYPQSDKTIKAYLKYGDCMPHPTWLGKKAVFEKLKGYRNINSCEDYDFILRGALQGLKYGVYTKPLLKYRINKLSISHINNVEQLMTTYYLQTMYAKKIIPSVNDIESFKKSSAGLKLKSDIKSYIRYTKDVSEKKQVLQILGKINLLYANSFVRRNFKNKLLRNIIK